MPLWTVYCTEGTYSSEEKRACADSSRLRLRSSDGPALLPR
jgi:hypothetical protein